MKLNDYTYHFCDRFVLLLVAVVGLVGTSYILLNESGQEGNSIDKVTIGFQDDSNEQNLSKYMKTLQSESPLMKDEIELTIAHRIHEEN